MQERSLVGQLQTFFRARIRAVCRTEALPRLFPCTGALGALANLGGLVFFGLLAAVVLHLAAYHLRTGSTASYMLLHCPWRPVLLVILAFAAFNIAVFWREVRALCQAHSLLSAQLPRKPATLFAPRRPLRLAGFFLSVYAISALATDAALRMAPMRAPMVMGGHSMIMAVTPIFALPIGQLLVAGVLALFLWRFERRVQVLRRAVALLRTLLALLVLSTPCTWRFAGPLARSLRLLYGFCIFSRPPPLPGNSARRVTGIITRLALSAPINHGTATV